MLQLGRKQRCDFFVLSTLLTLCTLLIAMIYCLQLNTFGWHALNYCLRAIPKWIISHRCSWMMVYVFWRNAHIRWSGELYCFMIALLCAYNSVNCHAVICLPCPAKTRIEKRDVWMRNCSYWLFVKLILELFLFFYVHVLTFECVPWFGFWSMPERILTALEHPLLLPHSTPFGSNPVALSIPHWLHVTFTSFDMTY